MRFIPIAVIIILLIPLISLIPSINAATSYVEETFEDGFQGTWVRDNPLNYFITEETSYSGSHSLKCSGSYVAEYIDTDVLTFPFDFSLRFYVYNVVENGGDFGFRILRILNNREVATNIDIVIQNPSGTGLNLEVWSVGKESASTVSYDTWHHINGTFWDYDAMTLYYDSNKIGTTFCTSNTVEGMQDIGIFLYGQNTGYIDDIFITEHEGPPLEGDEIVFVNDDNPWIVWNGSEMPESAIYYMTPYDSDTFFYFLAGINIYAYIADRFNTTIGGGFALSTTYTTHNFFALNSTAYIDFGLNYISSHWWNGTDWIQTASESKVSDTVGGYDNVIEIFRSGTVIHFIHVYTSGAGYIYGIWASWHYSEDILVDDNPTLIDTDTAKSMKHLCKTTNLINGQYNYGALFTYVAYSEYVEANAHILILITYDGVETLDFSILSQIEFTEAGDSIIFSPYDGIYVWNVNHNMTILKEIGEGDISFIQDIYMPGVWGIWDYTLINWNCVALVTFTESSIYRVTLLSIKNPANLLESDYISYASYNSSYQYIKGVSTLGNYLYVWGQNATTEIWVRWANMTSTLPASIDFIGIPTVGSPPLTVIFYLTTDFNYTNAPTNVSWDMDNNGTFNAYGAYVIYTFNTSGVYTVKCVCSNIIGNVTTTKINYIYVGFPPANESDLMDQAVIAIVWLLIVLLPGMLLNVRFPKIGFVGGLLIMVTILGVTYSGFLLVTVTAYIGCAILFVGSNKGGGI